MPHFKSAGEKLQAANEILLPVQALQGKHTLQTHWTLLRKEEGESTVTHTLQPACRQMHKCVQSGHLSLCEYMWIPPASIYRFLTVVSGGRGRHDYKS